MAILQFQCFYWEHSGFSMVQVAVPRFKWLCQDYSGIQESNGKTKIPVAIQRRKKIMFKFSWKSWHDVFSSSITKNVCRCFGSYNEGKPYFECITKEVFEIKI